MSKNIMMTQQQRVASLEAGDGETLIMVGEQMHRWGEGEKLARHRFCHNFMVLRSIISQANFSFQRSFCGHRSPHWRAIPAPHAVNEDKRSCFCANDFDASWQLLQPSDAIEFRTP